MIKIALILYVASYLGMINPDPPQVLMCYEVRFPAYRVGGDYSHRLFLPIHNLDRHLRQSYWWRIAP